MGSPLISKLCHPAIVSNLFNLYDSCLSVWQSLALLATAFRIDLCQHCRSLQGVECLLSNNLFVVGSDFASIVNDPLVCAYYFFA